MADKKCTAEQLKQMFLDDGRTNVSVVKADPIEEAIRNYWGERCPDYDADCFVCQAWKEFDTIEYVHKPMSKDELAKVKQIKPRYMRHTGEEL